MASVPSHSSPDSCTLFPHSNGHFIAFRLSLVSRPSAVSCIAILGPGARISPGPAPSDARVAEPGASENNTKSPVSKMPLPLASSTHTASISSTKSSDWSPSCVAVA